MNRITLIAVLLCASLAVVAFLGFRSASSSGADATAADAAVVGHELVAMHWELVNAHSKAVSLPVMEILGFATPPEATRSVDDLVAVRRRSVARLKEIEASTSAHSVSVTALMEKLEASTGQERRPLAARTGDMWDLVDLADEHARSPKALVGLSELHDAVFGSYLILGHAASLETTQSDVVPPANAREYFEDSEGIQRDQTTAFAPDGPGSLGGLAPVAEEVYPAELEDLAGRLRASGLADYDEWITGWNGSAPGPRPMSLSALKEAVVTEAPQLDELVGEVLESEQDVFMAEATTARASERKARLVGIIAGVLAALIAAGLVARAAFHGLTLNRERFTDPLTGVGNRRHLDEVLSARLGDDAFAHHAVAIIDVDRLKLTNDTWGHKAGDAVLSTLTAHLKTVLARFQGPNGRSTTLARLGGDEFLIGLHSARPIDVMALDDEIRELYSVRVAVGSSTPLSLAFSLGWAVEEGPASAETMMATADAEVYRDKARRRESLPEVDEQSPSGDPGRGV